jgi:hypothetical protein
MLLTMNDSFRSRMTADDNLDAWEAEGGAPAVAARTDAPWAAARPERERRLLERLGAAVLKEWHGLPMPLQRAIYDRAIDSETTCDPSVLKRSMARFLHDHKGQA